MVQKTVNAEAKAGLRSNIIVWDADSHYPRSHCLSQNTFTKMQTQDLIAKESKPKKSRPKDQKPADEKTLASPCTNESGKTSYQDKKKEYFQKKRDRKNSIPTIEDNAIKSEKKRNDQGDKKFYNCQKRAILLGTAQNLQKTSVSLNNLCTGDWK